MPGRPPLPPLPQRSLYNAPRRAGPGGVGALGSARPGRERQAPIPSAAGAGPSPLHDLYLQRPAVTVAWAQLLPALLDGHLLAGLLRTQRGVGSARVGSGRVGPGGASRPPPTLLCQRMTLPKPPVPRRSFISQGPQVCACRAGGRLMAVPQRSDSEGPGPSPRALPVPEARGTRQP